MKQRLVIQFRVEGNAAELEHIHMLEESLDRGLRQNRAGSVDGHDFGSGTANIYVDVGFSWSSCITVVTTYLRHHGVLDQAVIAKAFADGLFKVVFPESYGEPFSLI